MKNVRTLKYTRNYCHFISSIYVRFNDCNLQQKIQCAHSNTLYCVIWYRNWMNEWMIFNDKSTVMRMTIWWWHFLNPTKSMEKTSVHATMTLPILDHLFKIEQSLAMCANSQLGWIVRARYVITYLICVLQIFMLKNVHTFRIGIMSLNRSRHQMSC